MTLTAPSQGHSRSAVTLQRTQLKERPRRQEPSPPSGTVPPAAAQSPARSLTVTERFPHCRLPVFQAAELVTENCEAYEAHMRGVRDYLEERLVVRAARPGPASFSQRAVRGGRGPGEGRGEDCSPVPGDPGDNRGHERRERN